MVAALLAHSGADSAVGAAGDEKAASSAGDNGWLDAVALGRTTRASVYSNEDEGWQPHPNPDANYEIDHHSALSLDLLDRTKGKYQVLEGVWANSAGEETSDSAAATNLWEAHSRGRADENEGALAVEERVQLITASAFSDALADPAGNYAVEASLESQLVLDFSECE